MRPIVLRDESPPDDATVVVRGGLLAAESVQMSLERCRRQYGFLGLSVHGAVDMTVAQLLATVQQIGPVRYRQLRLSTFGTVREAGFPRWPTQVFRTTRSSSPTATPRHWPDSTLASIRPNRVRRCPRGEGERQ